MRRNMAGHRWWRWMALVAVWLAVVSPTVSRTVESCVFPELGAMCGHMPAMHAHHHMGGGHHDDGDDAACGYCTLFASTPSLGGSFFVAGVAFVAAAPIARRPVTRGFSAIAFRHAPPRGPPVTASA